MKAAKMLVWTMLVLPLMMLAPALAQAQSNESSRPAIAPDIRSSALWDGRKTAEFHSVRFPRMVRAEDAHFLIDDEYVLGITGNGESRAYPTRFASWHHIINDKIGKKENGGPSFVTVTYCIVCNSGMRFDTPIVNHHPLNFDFYGLYNGVMTMYDTNTRSVWLQVSGRAVKGPLLNTTLKSGPVLDTTWGQWKKLHPGTLVMAPDPGGNGNYEPNGSVMVRGYSSFPTRHFQRTLTHRDARLPMFESVLAVNLPVQASSLCATCPRTLQRAYPMKSFRGRTGVINDSLGKAPVAVLFLASTETMTAVSRVMDGQTLTLEVRNGPNSKAAFYDKETGTRWNVEGKAETGPLAGKQLHRVDSHMSQWYGWVSYFPQTTVYGQPDRLTQVSRQHTL